MTTTLNTLLAISAAALLAACGGGGDPVTNTQNTGANPVAVPVTPVTPVTSSSTDFANARVFVAGFGLGGENSSSTFNLDNCTYSGSVFNSVSAGTASLTITGNGNMTFNHPGDGALALNPISQTLVASTASEAELAISARDGETANRYGAYLLNVVPASGTTGAGVTEIRFNFNPSHDYINFPAATSEHRVRYITPGIEIICSFASRTMTANFGSFNARIAAATAGITTANQQNTSGTALNPLATLSGGNATWTNDQSGRTDRYSRLNIATGQISIATSTTGIFTPIDIDTELQASNGANFPFYSERKEGNVRTIEFSSNSGLKRTKFSVYSGTDLFPFASYRLR